MIFPSCRWWSCACSRVATITSLFRFESNRFRSTRSDWRLRACPKTASPASSFTRRQLGKLFICSGRCAPVNCERNRLFHLLFLSWKNETRFFGPPCAPPPATYMSVFIPTDTATCTTYISVFIPTDTATCTMVALQLCARYDCTEVYGPCVKMCLASPPVVVHGLKFFCFFIIIRCCRSVPKCFIIVTVKRVRGAFFPLLYCDLVLQTPAPCFLTTIRC